MNDRPTGRWARAARVAVCLGLSLPGAARAQPPERASPAAAVAASNRFGFELYGRVKAGQGNVICSPVSASIALTMAWAGARGETERQMARVLALRPNEPETTHAAFAALFDALNGRNGREGLTLYMADRLWGQRSFSFKPGFLRLLRERYRAPLELVDFKGASEEARTTINRWAAIQTRDRVREILQPGVLTEDTRLVLTNAVYLKGRWTRTFDKGQTADGYFTTAAGQVIAKMMHKEGDYRYARVRDAQLLELDYQGDLSMIVVLPDSVKDLEAVEGRLTGSYRAWLKQLHSKPVELALPRWKGGSSLELTEVLSAMGMPSAFSWKSADFSGISAESLFIAHVLQEAFVDVDEVGTEAAAVTAIVMQRASAVVPAIPPIPFHADHPFLYLIRDKKTGVVLFIGRVVDPR